jgi:hypothetical protein
VSASRVLSKEERRLVVDALRALAAETRRTKQNALGDRRFVCSPSVAAHIDQLSIRAGTLDRLAAEVNEYDVRLERLES